MTARDEYAAGADLVRYNNACRAVAEAKSIDEAKDIRDKSIAMMVYARQARNRDLEADAIEIRMRATRRLDQLRQAQKESVGLAQPGRPTNGLAENPINVERPTLASQGIDKNLAHQARQLGALSDEKFEDAVTTARTAAISSTPTFGKRCVAEEKAREADRVEIRKTIYQLYSQTSPRETVQLFDGSDHGIMVAEQLPNAVSWLLEFALHFSLDHQLGRFQEVFQAVWENTPEDMRSSVRAIVAASDEAQ